MTQPITVQYFAQLREQTGFSQEVWETEAQTPQALYLEIQQKHRTTAQFDQLRVAINAQFVPMDAPLRPGDAVVFIPPVAGG